MDDLAAQSQAPPLDMPVWLTDPDLDQPTSSNTDTAAKRLANAIKKALAYLSKALAKNEVVQQCSDMLVQPGRNNIPFRH